MNNEEAHARRTCRVFVLSILGIVVVTFLLIVWCFNGSPNGRHRLFPSATRTWRRKTPSPLPQTFPLGRAQADIRLCVVT